MIDDIYGGKYLSVSSCNTLGLWGQELKIAAVRTEAIDQKNPERKKVILTFDSIGKKELKELALNKTNAHIIAGKYGQDENAWVGKTMRLVKTSRQYQGQLVDAMAVVV